MNNKFDELTKNLAQSVTRRGALKKFGVRLGSRCSGIAVTSTRRKPMHTKIAVHPRSAEYMRARKNPIFC